MHQVARVDAHPMSAHI